MVTMGAFEDYTENAVLAEFGAEGMLLDGWRILFACYDVGLYEGEAFVLLTDPSGRLYSVSSSHCSCNGLEGTWEPRPDSWANITRLAEHGYGATAEVARAVLANREQLEVWMVEEDRGHANAPGKLTE